MKHLITLIAATLVLGIPGLAQSAPASTEIPRQIALVIGNSDYDLDGTVDPDRQTRPATSGRRFMPDVRNARADAEDVAELLRHLGFQVELLLNARESELRAALGRFAGQVSTAHPSDRLVLYYSGHGVQVQAQSYLIPAGAEILEYNNDHPPDYWQDREVVQGLVPLSGIGRSPWSGPGSGFALIVLNSCRENPWPSLAGRGVRIRGASMRAATTIGDLYVTAVGRGMLDRPSRTILFLAAAPGNVASDIGSRNSPFAAAFLRWAADGSRTVHEMIAAASREVLETTSQLGFNQHPHSYSNFLDPVCLGECQARPPTGQPYQAQLRDASVVAVVMEARSVVEAALSESMAAKAILDQVRDQQVVARDFDAPPPPGRTRRLERIRHDIYEDDPNTLYSGETVEGEPDGRGIFLVMCTRIFLRQMCPLPVYETLSGQFTAGRFGPLGTRDCSVDRVPRSAGHCRDFDEWQIGRFDVDGTLAQGIRILPNGDRSEGRFVAGRLVEGVEWTNFGYRATEVSSEGQR